jgi:hypothetical protein
MGQGGRITCPRCGSNNFDTVTACWKCSNPLSAASSVAAAPAPARQAVPAYAPSAVSAASPVVQPTFTDRAVSTVAAIPQTLGNAAAANRAAFWLGMLFPYFGLPIGLAFIMCDDRRRQEVGRLCVMWSLLSGVIHFLFMIVSLLGMRQYIAAALGAVQSGAGKLGGGGLGGGGMEGGF